MDDLGAPVSHLAVKEGVPIYDSRGRRIGVLDRVMTDEVTGIFKGVIVHTLPLPGRHLYAGHEQVGEMREGGIVLSVERDELPQLGARSDRARGSEEAPENPLQARLRRAWDWITGVR